MVVKTLYLGIGALLLSGCFTHDVRDSRFEKGERHQRWTSHFFWGLAGHETVDVREWCGNDDVASLGTGANGGTWLVTLLTLGIYSPKTVWVHCASGRAKTAVLLGEDGRPREITRFEGNQIYRGVPELVDAHTGEWAVVAHQESSRSEGEGR